MVVVVVVGLGGVKKMTFTGSAFGHFASTKWPIFTRTDPMKKIWAHPNREGLSVLVVVGDQSWGNLSGEYGQSWSDYLGEVAKADYAYRERE